jgi:alkylhydroperoxidase family enzyme
VRFAVARQQGLTEDRVALIDEGFEASALSSEEKAVVRYADVFLQAPAEPDDRLRADMLASFTPGQIVEFTVGIALFMGFSKIAISLGQAPDDMPTMVVPTPDWVSPR